MDLSKLWKFDFDSVFVPEIFVSLIVIILLIIVIKRKKRKIGGE